MTASGKLTNRKTRRIIWIVSICVVAIALGGSLYYFLAVRPPQSAAFVGAFFGFYPANKAAECDPIDALSYE